MHSLAQKAGRRRAAMIFDYLTAAKRAGIPADKLEPL
jgi:hypothetical protein